MTIHETTDRVQAIGREFLKEFPKGWYWTLWARGDGGFTCTAVGPEWTAQGWPDRMKSETRSEASTPDEARRLCREEAERKSKS